MKHNFQKKVSAILFDMDGVLLDSERGWQKYGPQFWADCGIEDLPPEIHERIYGISMSEEHKILTQEIDFKMTLEEYVAHYDKYSERVYSESTLAHELEKTLTLLRSMGLRLGIVTSSLGKWVDLFEKRLGNPNYFTVKLSIADDEETKQKPSPDGYLKAARLLAVTTSEIIAVEDSNRGIKSSAAAGIFTVASSEFIDTTYKQTGYDYKIESLRKLQELLT